MSDTLPTVGIRRWNLQILIGSSVAFCASRAMAVAVAFILAGNDFGLEGVSRPFLAAANLDHVNTRLT